MVKCPSCGTENPTSSAACAGCGKPLVAAKKEMIRSAERPSPKSPMKIDHNEIIRKMKLDYSHGGADKNERVLDGILSLLSHFQTKQMDVRALITEAANMIYKQLGVANLSIGLRSASDGMFRYEVLVGFRPETEAAQRKLTYTEKQFTEDAEYKGSMISRISKVYLAEDLPYKVEEVESYDHRGLLGMRRLSPTDSLESDYIDTWILGANGRLLGWIEFSGLRTGKIPEIQTIKQMEIIASILGAALAQQGAK